jgi:hypothetical protein
MKEWMILRNFVQELLKSELRWRRYGEKSFGDLYIISGKWLGLYLKILSDSRALFRKVWAAAWFRVTQGGLCKTGRDFWLGIYFPKEIYMDSSMAHEPQRTAGPSWTENRGRWGVHRSFCSHLVRAMTACCKVGEMKRTMHRCRGNAQHRLDNGGEGSARIDDGASTIEGWRSWVWVVGCFFEVWVPFT